MTETEIQNEEAAVEAAPDAPGADTAETGRNGRKSRIGVVVSDPGGTFIAVMPYGQTGR